MTLLLFNRGMVDFNLDIQFNRCTGLKIMLTLLHGATLLAHLWGAYAIPVALSGVRCPSFVVHRPSYVLCRLCPI